MDMPPASSLDVSSEEEGDETDPGTSGEVSMKVRGDMDPGNGGLQLNRAAAAGTT